MLEDVTPAITARPGAVPAGVEGDTVAVVDTATEVSEAVATVATTVSAAAAAAEERVVAVVAAAVEATAAIHRKRWMDECDDVSVGEPLSAV